MWGENGAEAGREYVDSGGVLCMYVCVCERKEMLKHAHVLRRLWVDGERLLRQKSWWVTRRAKFLRRRERI